MPAVFPITSSHYTHPRAGTDWVRLSRPGLIDIQFRIFTDYDGYVARFPEISAYHRELDRLEMHIFDSGQELLETHSRECAALMREFVLNVMGLGPEGSSAERL